jgi:hypothetical protein
VKHLTPDPGLRGEILSPDSASIINEHDVAAKMTRGKYQLTATRGAVEVLRQGFDDLEEAHRAVAKALVRLSRLRGPIDPGRLGLDFGAGAIELTPRVVGSAKRRPRPID